MKNPSIWKESLTWIVLWIRSVREPIWKGDTLVANLEELENDGRIGNLLIKTQCKGSNFFCPKMGNSYFQWQRDEEKMVGGNQELRTSILIREHPIQGEGQRDFSRRIRIVSTSTTSRLTSGCQWSDKWFLVHVRETSYTAIRHDVWTQSQILLAEIRIISFSIGIHWRLQKLHIQTWMLCKKSASMINGISMDQEISLILGQISLSFTLYQVRISGRIYEVRERLTKTVNDIQAISFMARTLDRNGKEC